MSLGDGVKLLAGFDLKSKRPLDNRLYCKTIDERDELVIKNAAFPSMLVYVEDVNQTYVYKEDLTWSIVDWDAQGITYYNQLKEPPIVCADLSNLTEKHLNYWYCHKGSSFEQANGVYVISNRIYQYDGTYFVELKVSSSTTDTAMTSVQSITVSMPSGSTSGTLTAEQWKILQKSNSNYIILQYTSGDDTEYELYYLNDKDHTPGIWIYTHDGFNEIGKVKYLSLTISTMAFTLSEYEYKTKKYWHNITAKYEAYTNDVAYYRCLVNMQFISDDGNEAYSSSKLLAALQKYFDYSGRSYLPVYGEYRAYSAQNITNLTEWKFLNAVSIGTSDSGLSYFLFSTNAFSIGTLQLSDTQLQVVSSNVVEI